MRGVARHSPLSVRRYACTTAKPPSNCIDRCCLEKNNPLAIIFRGGFLKAITTVASATYRTFLIMLDYVAVTVAPTCSELWLHFLVAIFAHVILLGGWEGIRTPLPSDRRLPGTFSVPAPIVLLSLSI